MPPAAKPGLGPRSLKCTACGAPLTLRAPARAERVACEFCGALLDAKDPDLAVIQTVAKKHRYKPLIPLGTRGRLRGDMWEVIGYLRRRVVVDGTPYTWCEYLLHNPYKGFRWLAEYNGHWSFIKTTKGTPEGFGASRTYMDRTFARFQTATAATVFVLGEFYWQVEVGEKSEIEDYICPPYTLSCDKTGNEITWTLGEYLDPTIVWESFALPGTAPEAFGVAPAQISPYRIEYDRVKMTCLSTVLFAVVIFFLNLTTSQNAQVFKESFHWDRADAERSRISQPFELKGQSSNLEVATRAEVSNSWVYLNFALIDEKTDQAIDFARDIEYYAGPDWSEGSRDDTVIIPRVPPGTYRLRVEPETDPAMQRLTYQVTIRRDVPRPLFFFMALIAVGLPAFFYGYRANSYEALRWSESDYPEGPLVAYGENS